MALRVLHVLDHSWPVMDGYSQRSRSIVSAQLQHGMRPAVLTGPLHQLDDPTASETAFDGLPYFRTPHDIGLPGLAIKHRWPFLREWGVVRLLRRRIETLLQNSAFDLVHAHSPALCGLAAGQAARACGVPFVYEIRAFWEDAAMDPYKTSWTSMRYRLAQRVETHVVRRADAVVGIAHSILDDLQVRGISASKLFHVPNGVDAARFAPVLRDDSLAASVGSNVMPCLGFIGTLFPWEGIAWLVRAAKELREKGIEFKLVIVGDGADVNELKKSIQENNAASFVFFLGRVPHDQVERYYSVMDVMVYPRRSVRLTELVTPLKPLEAMALGKAVLASSVGGIRELIVNDETGMLFEPENIGDFCRQATRLLQDPALRTRLGDRARQAICVDKDWKTLVCRYEGVYDSAIRNFQRRN